jgi:hypothetical protein
MPRHTPVPIAAARPRKQQKPSPGKEHLVQGKPVSTAAGPVANIRTRRERPCDACRRRKSRCVIHEGAVLCVLCEFHKQECTFVQSPLPRKRKVVDDGKKDSPNNQKKRYVLVLLHFLSLSSCLRVVSTIRYFAIVDFHAFVSFFAFLVVDAMVIYRTMLCRQKNCISCFQLVACRRPKA